MRTAHIILAALLLIACGKPHGPQTFADQSYRQSGAIKSGEIADLQPDGNVHRYCDGDTAIYAVSGGYDVGVAITAVPNSVACAGTR